MKTKFVILVIIFITSWPLACSADPENNQPVLEDIKIGFNGYYRPGYWCPLKARFKTYQSAFKGKAVFQIDNNTCSFPLEIPAGSIHEISGSILIHSSHPQITLQFYPRSNQAEQPKEPELLNTAGSLNQVKTDEFLIGVEHNIFYNFLKEFGRFSDAVKHSRFFSFTPEELPRHSLPYETVDLLVVSEETFKTAGLKEALTNWRDSADGNILVYTGGEIALSRHGGIKQLKPIHSLNPCINPEAIQLFKHFPPNKSSLPSLKQFNQTILSALLVCFLSSLIILTIRLGRPRPFAPHSKERNWFFYGILSAIIAGTVFVLIIFFCPASLITGENIGFIIYRPETKTGKEYHWLGLTSLRNDTFDFTIETEDGTLRPIFSGLDSAGQNPFNLFFNNNRMLWKNQPVNQKQLTCFEKNASREQTGIRIVTGHPQNSHLLLNESGSHLQDAWLVSRNLYFRLGNLSGQSEILLPDLSSKNNGLSYEQWKQKYNSDRTKIPERGAYILEFCRKRFNLENQTYIFGWIEKKDVWPGLAAQNIPIHYHPVLWIILLNNFQ